VIASRAAREKLRTDVTEMSVLARHMLMAFRRTGRGAALIEVGDGRRANRERTKVAQQTGGRIYASWLVSTHAPQITTKIEKPTKCEATTTMKASRRSRRRVTHFFFELFGEILAAVSFSEGR